MATKKKPASKAVAAKAKPVAKKTAAKKPVAVKKAPAQKAPVKKTAVKAAAVKKAAVKKAAPAKAAVQHGGLHYDKDAVIREYDTTYDIFIKGLAVIIGGVLIYFFIFIVYLGGTSHTKHADFVEHFGDRIDYSVEYEGLKLPIYGTDE